MSLTLKKGGKLILSKHNKRDKNVTKYALFHLMQPCVLDDDVTLRDIFLVLKRDLDIYKLILNNWVEELVEEAFEKKKRKSDCLDVEYLYLSWVIDAQSGKYASVEGMIFPRFDGWGKWNEELFGQTEGGIAIEFTPVYELIDLPVKLKSKLTLEKWDKKHNRTVEYFENPDYSLFHILYAIIWELSFCGSPKNREKHSEMLSKLADKASKEFDSSKLKKLT